MEARYNSFCKKCNTSVSVGEDISKDGDIWVHTKCLYTDDTPEQPPTPDPVGLELDPNAKPGECGICTRILPSIGDKYFHNERAVCETCFDGDIKKRWGFW